MEHSCDLSGDAERQAVEEMLAAARAGKQAALEALRVVLADQLKFFPPTGKRKGQRRSRKSS